MVLYNQKNLLILYVTILQALFSFVQNFKHDEFELKEIETKDMSEKVLTLLNKLLVKPDPTLTFSPTDINLLNSSEYSKDKKTAIEKYEKRIASFHCTNTFVLKYIDNKIRSNMLVNDKPNPEYYMYFELFQMHVQNMLALLYNCHLKASGWVVAMYIQLVAIAQKNENIMKQKFSTRHELLRKMSDHNAQCEKKKLIPTLDYNKDITKMYADSGIEDIIEHLYVNNEFENMYDNNLFTAERITLKFLMDNYERFIFNSSFSKHPEWTAIKCSLSGNKDKYKDLYNSGDWVMQPFVFMDFHLTLQHTIYTHILIYVTVHLQSFHIKFSQKFMLDIQNIIADIKKEQHSGEIDNLWNLIADPLRRAIQFLGTNDSLFQSILDICEGQEVKLPKLDKLEIYAQLMLVKCFNVLEMNSIHSEFFIDILNKNITYNLDEKKIKKNIAEFNNYLSGMEKLFKNVRKDMFFVRFLAQDYLLMRGSRFLPHYIVYKA